MSSQAPIGVQQPQASAQLFELANGFMVSAALHVVARLKIADLLAAGPQPVAELAKATRVREDGLYRVLRALASIGVFSEPGLRYFSLTPMAEPLRSDSPHSIRDLILWMSDPFHFRTWAEMMHCVETGETAIERLYGKPAFDFLAENAEESAIFNAGMSGFCRLAMPAVLKAYDFSGIGSLTDVAGGHGLVLTSILKEHPKMRGILFELEHVAAGARERIRELGLAERCQVVSGSFFDWIPAGADAYLLQHIVHDWQDEQAIQILKNVRRALGSKANGKLLLLEGIIAPGNEPGIAKFIDLEMLILAGGRERSQEEFAQLLESSGFRLNRVVYPEGPICVVEAVPV
jgi:hypothetical protein